jgi:hypothetical protein
MEETADRTRPLCWSCVITSVQPMTAPLEPIPLDFESGPMTSEPEPKLPSWVKTGALTRNPHTGEIARIGQILQVQKLLELSLDGQKTPTLYIFSNFVGIWEPYSGRSVWERLVGDDVV